MKGFLKHDEVVTALKEYIAEQMDLIKQKEEANTKVARRLQNLMSQAVSTTMHKNSENSKTKEKEINSPRSSALEKHESLRLSSKVNTYNGPDSRQMVDS